MKRAEGNKVGSSAFERQITADDIDDITGGTDLLEGRLRKQPSHNKTLPISRVPEFWTDFKSSRADDVGGI
jgi:hypothetical protein